MPKRKDLTDDEILRFQRFSITESVAATFTQQAFDTQLSIDRGFIWMIHFVESDINVADLDSAAAGTGESIELQISRESKSAIISLNDPDLITYFNLQIIRSAAIGTDAGPLWTLDTFPHMQKFAPPIVYAAQNVYIAIKGTAATPQVVTGRIGYTLRRVSDKFFYRVAQALIS